VALGEREVEPGKPRTLAALFGIAHGYRQGRTIELGRSLTPCSRIRHRGNGLRRADGAASVVPAHKEETKEEKGEGYGEEGPGETAMLRE